MCRMDDTAAATFLRDGLVFALRGNDGGVRESIRGFQGVQKLPSHLSSVGGIPRRLPIGEISKSASNVGSSALLRGEGSIAGKVGQSRLSLPLNVPR